MPLDAKLSAALINGGRPEWHPRRILGARLRPFCLWHRFVLKAVNSPFVCPGRVSLLDLRIAAGICRLGFRDSRIHRPWLIPLLIWLKAILATLLTIRRKYTEENPNPLQRALQRQCALFQEYCGDYLQEPEYGIRPREETGETTPRVPSTPAPDEIEFLNELIVHTHWDDRKIWELPLGYANWLRVMARRQAGLDVDFTNEQQRDLQSMLPPEYRFK